MRNVILGLAAFALAAGLAGPAAAKRHWHHGDGRGERIVLQPEIIDVGKWAEGLTYDGHVLWVAESGQRTVAKIDLERGRVVGHARVGRLPVAMAATPRGDSFAMVNTDQLIYRLNGRRGVVARLGECPDGMIADRGMLWALTEPDCSSRTSRVTGVDPRTGAKSPSADLGEWATALTAHRGQIWVTHARGPAFTIVDEDTLRAEPLDIPGVSLWAATATAGNVYGGGRFGDDNSSGLVVMVDPASRREINRAERLPERVAQMTSDAELIVAVGEQGTIWVFTADDLTLLRTITLTSGAFQPRGAIIVGDKLLLTSQTRNGDNGAVLSLTGWRPD